MRLLRIVSPLVGALLFVPASLEAQSRADLLRQAQAALDDFDATRAIRLARSAVNPTLGPLDSTWARGVHLLTQTLIEEQQQPLAKTWAQWAMRSQPTMPIDTVNYISAVVTLLREAKESAAPSAADAIAAGGEVRVAAYDVTSNLAVLVLPTAAPETLTTAARSVEGQSLWGVALADCAGSATPTARVLLQGSAPATLSLSAALEAAAVGYFTMNAHDTQSRRDP